MDVKLKTSLDRPLFTQTRHDSHLSQGMLLTPNVSLLVSYPLSCTQKLDLSLLWTQARRPPAPLLGLCSGAVLGCAAVVAEVKPLCAQRLPQPGLRIRSSLY